MLWEHAVAQSGVPRYLGSPDDLKLLLMKAVNHKTPDHRYRVQSGSRLSFHGRWYASSGLLKRLSGRKFEAYYDRRDISVLYLFVAGSYVGEAYCAEFLGGRVSEWEAAAMRKSDTIQKNKANAEAREARARTQDEAASSRRRRSAQIRASEKSREYDRQREEIHPTPVLERLASLAPQPAPSPKLPPAVPNTEPDRPVKILPVRRLREEP